MISDKMNKALNEQVNAELFSSYLYLGMSAWFSEKSLNGFASWMRVQAQEEMSHAMKIYNFILERGGNIQLTTIEKPESEWGSPLEVVQEVANHEAKVTGLVNDLVDVALEQRDHATNIFLQWFVTEQVEEEASVGDVLERAKMIGDDSAGMFALDMEMAKREFTEDEE
ncbi:MAG: ferritin [Desulfobulbaceae bacterium]|nr:ferritin [Desulfobulbaceae bacterium]